MKLTITARNMVVTPAITKRIEKKTETMGRYLWPETEMQIKMSKERARRVVEITVPMGKNVILRSESSADDNLFLAIDKALAKMERQIRKHRTKLGKNLREEIPDVPEYIEEDQAEEQERKIVKRKTFPVRPMSVEGPTFCISERTETWVCWNPKHKDDQNVRIANQEKAVL